MKHLASERQRVCVWRGAKVISGEKMKHFHSLCFFNNPLINILRWFRRLVSQNWSFCLYFVCVCVCAIDALISLNSSCGETQLVPPDIYCWFWGFYFFFFFLPGLYEFSTGSCDSQRLPLFFQDSSYMKWFTWKNGRGLSGPVRRFHNDDP